MLSKTEQDGGLHETFLAHYRGAAICCKFLLPKTVLGVVRRVGDVSGVE